MSSRIEAEQEGRQPVQDEWALEREWGSDPFFFTEAARGGPWIWRVGASGFEGEPLGPVRHAHDDAAEYYFMYSGSAHVETGGEEFVLHEGQLGYIPPDAPHNFLGPASNRDACLFCVIAPNFSENKWRVRDFKPGSDLLRMEVARPFVDAELPGGEHLGVSALSIDASADVPIITPVGKEVVYLVIQGTLKLELSNGLRGHLNAGTFVHVRERLRHRISGVGNCRVVRFACLFDAWKGVATGDDL